jgi:hypothetical protein
MKRIMGVSLLAIWAAGGCLSLPSLSEKPAPKAATEQQTSAKKEVRPEQVNESNAHEVAGALLNEMDAAGATPSK